MKSNRGNDNAPRKRHRRTEAELIAALEEKIHLLERRKQARAIRQDPTLKLADRVMRALKKAEGKFQASGRLDLANSVKAAAIAIQQAIGVNS